MKSADVKGWVEDKTVAISVGMLITLLGLVWASAASWNSLETKTSAIEMRQERIVQKVQRNETAVEESLRRLEERASRTAEDVAYIRGVLERK
jgi:hypothetical protein